MRLKAPLDTFVGLREGARSQALFFGGRTETSTSDDQDALQELAGFDPGVEDRAGPAREAREARGLSGPLRTSGPRGSTFALFLAAASRSSSSRRSRGAVGWGTVVGSGDLDGLLVGDRAVAARSATRSGWTRLGPLVALVSLRAAALSVELVARASCPAA